jgi:hypothetical protein
MFPITLLIYFLICGIIGLLLWLKMLKVLESKGREVSYLLVTPRQYCEFVKVIREELDQNLKNKYRIVLWAQVGIIPLYIIGMIILF